MGNGRCEEFEGRMVILARFLQVQIPGIYYNSLHMAETFEWVGHWTNPGSRHFQRNMELETLRKFVMRMNLWSNLHDLRSCADSCSVWYF